MKKFISVAILHLLIIGCAAPSYKLPSNQEGVSELLLTSNHKPGFVINIYEGSGCENPRAFARGHVFGGRKSRDGDALTSVDSSLYSIIKKLGSGRPVNMAIKSWGFNSECVIPFTFTPEKTKNYNLDMNWVGNQCVLTLNEIDSRGEYIRKKLDRPEQPCVNGF